MAVVALIQQSAQGFSANKRHVAVQNQHPDSRINVGQSLADGVSCAQLLCLLYPVDVLGIGQMLTSAVLGREYGVVQAGVMMTALLFIGVNLLVDLSYPILDPRLRDRK